MANTNDYLDYSALEYYDSKLKAFIATADTNVLTAATLKVTQAATPTSGSALTYEVKQGTTDIGKIEIPVDKHVTAGVIRTDSATQKSYIDLTIAGETNKVSIDISSLNTAEILNKADKVSNATNGHLASLDATGNLADSGKSASDLTNVLEGVQVNGSNLTIDANKKVNVTVATGTVNGTVAVNGADVAIKGLGSAAYTSSTAYEAAGAVNTAIGALDTASDIALASKSGKAVTIKAIKEVDGVIAASTNTSLNVTLADVASTGSIDDVSGAGTAAKANVATVAIGGTGEVDAALVSAGQVKTYVANEIKDLEGAMHFKGAVTPTSSQSDADAMNAYYTSTKETPEKGDVFIITTNSKEYVVSEVKSGAATYREIGDEGTYVKKTTTIAGVDLQDNITKSEMLTALNVADGAQVNTLTGVQVNGSNLSISNKKVNITVAEGTTNGTLAVNGADVAVHGLGTMAYKSLDPISTTQIDSLFS